MRCDRHDGKALTLYGDLSSGTSYRSETNVTRPPTDLKILEEIYQRYYGTFCAYSHSNPSRDTKVYVPIDIQAIANRLRVDGDIVHGRLYHCLNDKYSIVRDNGSTVPFFLFLENSAAESRHQVQFPILGAAVAELRESHNKYLWATGVAAASFIIALVALIVGIVCQC